MKVTIYPFVVAVLLGLCSWSCNKSTAGGISDLDAENTVAAAKADRDEVVPANRNPSNPNLVFEETLENDKPFNCYNQKSLGEWEYAIRYVDKPAFRGERSVRFEIREWQRLVQGGKRAEVVIVKGTDKDISREAWYSFAAYFPSSGYEYDNDREVINQWFQDGSPATSLRTQRDRFLLETGNKRSKREQYDLGPIEKDRWHEFVFHFIHDDDSKGLIEIWHDGEKVLKRRGGNMYEGNLPKWKIGLYKATFKSRYGTSQVNRRVIYFDNIRVGNRKASFEDMTTLYKNTPPPDIDPETPPVTDPEEGTDPDNEFEDPGPNTDK
ncbi:polysaccharide lyase [Paraflavisolibacter sp. H34]|uniref:polysaccharide lyase n=1 Tax=Huijunlia imazamoxiresistens TaxID=3127457 RepID=UPI0030178CB4